MSAFQFEDPYAINEQILARFAELGPQMVGQRNTLQREDALRGQQRKEQLGDLESQRRFDAANQVSTLLSQLDPNDPANAQAIAEANKFLQEINSGAPVAPGQLGSVSGRLGMQGTVGSRKREDAVAETGQRYQQENIQLQGAINQSLQSGQLKFTAKENAADRNQQFAILDEQQSHDLLMQNLTNTYNTNERLSRQEFDKAMTEAGFQFQGNEAEKNRLFQTVQAELDRNHQNELIALQNDYATASKAAESFRQDILAFAGDTSPESQAQVDRILKEAEKALGKGSTQYLGVLTSAATLGNQSAKNTLAAQSLDLQLSQSQLSESTARVLLMNSQATGIDLQNQSMLYENGRKKTKDVEDDSVKASVDIYTAAENGDVATLALYRAAREHPDAGWSEGTIRAVNSLSDEEWAEVEATAERVSNEKKDTVSYNAELRTLNIKQLKQAYASNDASAIQVAIENLSSNFDSPADAQAWLSSMSDSTIDSLVGVPGAAKSVRSLIMSNTYSKEVTRQRSTALTAFDNVLKSVTSDPASQTNAINFAVTQGLMSPEAAKAAVEAQSNLFGYDVKAKVAQALSENVQLNETWRADFVSALTASGVPASDAEAMANSMIALKQDEKNVQLLSAITQTTQYDAQGNVVSVGTIENSERWDAEFRRILDSQGVSKETQDFLSKAYRLQADRSQLMYENDIKKMLGLIPESMSSEDMNAVRQMIDSRQDAEMEAIKATLGHCMTSLSNVDAAVAQQAFGRECSVDERRQLNMRVANITQATTQLQEQFLGNTISAYQKVNPVSGDLEITDGLVNDELRKQFSTLYPVNPDRYVTLPDGTFTDPNYVMWYNNEFAKFSKAIMSGESYQFPNFDGATLNNVGQETPVVTAKTLPSNPVARWIVESNNKFVGMVGDTVNFVTGQGGNSTTPTQTTTSPIGAVDTTPLASVNFAPSEDKTLSFDKAFDLVVNSEGGYSTDRNDKGNWTGGEVGVGEFKGTKYGISAACLAPEHKVLTSDLTWVEVGHLKEGQEIIAFDEFGERRGKLNLRRFRKAIVEKTGRITLPSYKITLLSGKIIRASSEHLWLAQVGTHRNYQWVKTVDLLTAPLPGGKGNWRHPETKTYIKQVMDTWDTMKSYESGYLAGVLDGEGHFSNGRLGFTQRDNELLRQSIDFANQLGFETTLSKPRSKANGVVKSNHDIYDVGFTSKDDNKGFNVLRVVGSIRPPRLLKKAQDWMDGRRFDSCYSGKDEVVSVEYIGEIEVVALKTSTNTVIAEGLATHNSYPNLDIKNLSLEDAKKIYYENYWLPSGAQELAPAAAYVLFDAAINSGVGTAKQQMASAGTVADFINARAAFYGDLARREPATYGTQLNGWMNRITDITNNSLTLSGY